MYRSRTVRELLRWHQQELARRDEFIQSLLDRVQHPDRTPIWREIPAPLEDEEFVIPIHEVPAYMVDPDQLP